MGRILAIDVGAGTQDILLYDTDRTIENCVKLVLPARTVIVAERIAQATCAGRDVFLTGSLMGGGPLASAAKRHIRAGLSVYAAPLAAKSIRDDPREVEALGVKIVESAPSYALPIATGDVDLSSLAQALAFFDVSLPERVAIAVQDHGESPGISQRRFRFQHWRRFVEAGGDFAALAYEAEPPTYLTRMWAVLADAPGALLMDTCAAAVVGALCDEQVAACRAEGLVVVNIGNQHTLGALCQGNRVWGLFEHHTVLMNAEKLVHYVEALQRGTIDDEEVYGDNGHGAYVHPGYLQVKANVLHSFEFVAVTGPNRQMARGLGYHFATPYGDMMLSGCFGLVTAARWKGWLD